MRNVVTDTQHDLNNIGSRSIVVQAFLQSPWRRQERRESDAALRCARSQYGSRKQGVETSL